MGLRARKRIWNAPKVIMVKKITQNQNTLPQYWDVGYFFRIGACVVLAPKVPISVSQFGFDSQGHGLIAKGFIEFFSEFQNAPL